MFPLLDLVMKIVLFFEVSFERLAFDDLENNTTFLKIDKMNSEQLKVKFVLLEKSLEQKMEVLNAIKKMI